MNCDFVLELLHAYASNTVVKLSGPHCDVPPELPQVQLDAEVHLTSTFRGCQSQILTHCMSILS